MPSISSDGVEIHYEDTGGEGRPVVLIHGWPLSGASWKHQLPALTEAGHRVVTYDRRGFGQSTKVGPYDYDTFAGDLNALLTQLDLTDATLVGFSMGGGEVARYLGRFGDDRIRSAVLAGAITPWLEKSDANPDGGLPREDAEGMQAALREDRDGFFDEFTTNFFTAGEELKVSESDRQEALALAAQADLDASVDCIVAWLTDFTADLNATGVPILVVHGDSDAIVPVEASGQRVAHQIPSAELVTVAEGPHGFNVSHADEFNRTLVEFLAR